MLANAMWSGLQSGGINVTGLARVCWNEENRWFSPENSAELLLFPWLRLHIGMLVNKPANHFSSTAKKAVSSTVKGSIMHSMAQGNVCQLIRCRKYTVLRARSLESLASAELVITGTYQLTSGTSEDNGQPLHRYKCGIRQKRTKVETAESNE